MRARSAFLGRAPPHGMRALLFTCAVLVAVLALLFLPSRQSLRPESPAAPAEPPAGGRIESAETDELVRATPGLTPAALRPAARRLARRQWQEALEALEALDALPPEERDALPQALRLRQEGIAALRAGQVERAATALAGAAEIGGSDALAAWTVHRLAEALIADGEHAEALALLGDASGDDPGAMADRAQVRSRALLAAGRRPAALAALGPLIAVDPRRIEGAGPVTRARRATALALGFEMARELGDTDARRSFLSALMLEHAASPEALKLLEDDAAAALWEKRRAALLVAGRHRDVFGRAESLVAEAPSQRAIPDLEALLAAEPDDILRDEALLLLGRAHRHVKRPADALRILQQVSDADPEVKARASYNAALAARSLRRTGDRRRLLEEVARSAPSEWRDRAAEDLADIAEAGGRSAESRRWLATIVDEGSTPGWREDAAWRIARGLDEEGRGREALAAYRTLLETSPRGRLSGGARYWAARRLSEAGEDAAADALLRELVATCPNDYHAMRASEELGVPLALPAPPPVGEERELVADWLDDLARLDERAAARLGAFTSLGLADEALSVLDDTPAFDAAEAGPASWPLRLLLLQRSGRHRDALVLLRDEVPDWRCRSDLPATIWRAAYPLEHAPLVFEHGGAHGLDHALVLGLIHQESVFEADAKSWVGARGLMQIMPGTGRTIAGWLDERIRTDDLHDPDLNVRYGTTYLARLLRNFDRPELALAGYNAGGGRVRRWSRDTPPGDIALWVERIPFDETRDYVKAVTWNRELYRSLWLGEPEPAEGDSSPSSVEVGTP